MRALVAAILVLAVLGCAPETPPSVRTLSPADSAFNIAELLPARRITSLTRRTVPNQFQFGEEFQFAGGAIVVEHLSINATFNPQSVRMFTSREEIEAWARGNRGQTGELVRSTSLAHNACRGGGWLLTFSTATANLQCSFGRAAYGIHSQSDGAGGFIMDTLLAMAFCHPPGAFPQDLEGVFRRIRLRES